MAEILAGSRTAFHEAAHAVVARALGYQVTDINMAPPAERKISGYVQHEKTKSALEDAVIGLAGCLAVVHKFGEEYGALSDGDVVSYRGLSQDEQKEARVRSATLVLEHWSEVEQLAHELFPANPTQ